jgi:hydrogenase maturation protease
MRILIASVGYSNLSDLSVGPLVAAQLRRETWPDHVELDDLSYGPIAVVHRFAEVSPPYCRLVLVGAADRRAGLRQRPEAAQVRCYRWQRVLPPAEEVQARVAEAVTGVIDLDNLLVVAQQFGALPEEVFVIEIQPMVTEFGLELSPAVAELLPEVCRLVRRVALEGIDAPEVFRRGHTPRTGLR